MNEFLQVMFGPAFLEFCGNLFTLVPVVAPAVLLIAIIVDGAKKAKILPNGYAPVLSGVLNAAVFLVYYLAGPDRTAQIDGIIKAVTVFAPFIVGYAASVFSTAKAHNAMVEAGFGYSYSEEAWKKKYPEQAGG